MRPNNSVHFASGNLSLATPVNPQSCTVACFFRRTVAGNGQSLVCIGGNSIGGPANSFLALQDFTTLQLGTSDVASFPTITTLVTNRWYFGCFTGNGTTGIGYAIPARGALSTATDTGIVAGTPQNFNVSNTDEADGNWQGDITGVKVWPFPLSGAEVLREVVQLAPVKNGAVVYLPLLSAAQAAYDERISRVWTVAGTLTTAASSPGIPEVLHRRAYSYSQYLPPPTNAIFFGTDA